MSQILVVDNEKSICDLLSILLGKEGHEVMAVNSADAAVKLLKDNSFDLVITDIRMPRSSGIDVLDSVNELSPRTPVVMMTAYASAETAVMAMKKGAYDYISKPFKIEDVQLIVKNALEKKKLSDENVYLKTALKDKFSYSSIIGKSAAIQKVFEFIDKVADSNATVLLTGESGTGKELVARAIHYNGPRKNYPFISINCGAVPEHLLESELFGHEKGSFTSADSTKVGLMEAAQKGSFLLDEVYEAPLSIQVKLLRVLQEKEFTRVGATKPVKVDVRIIAATNRDLSQAVRDKTFREDLFYRLNVIPIRLPPLRERKEDIPLLLSHFIEKYNAQHHRKIQIQGIEPEALRILERYPWPGNVRELENVIERAVVLEMGDMISLCSLPDDLREAKVEPLDLVPLDNDQVDLEKTLDHLEKRMIQGALVKTHGVIHKAAKLLNLSFRSMRYRVQKHNLRGSGDEG